MPRIANFPFFARALATAPPCAPVTPITAIVRFDIASDSTTACLVMVQEARRLWKLQKQTSRSWLCRISLSWLQRSVMLSSTSCSVLASRRELELSSRLCRGEALCCGLQLATYGPTQTCFCREEKSYCLSVWVDFLFSLSLSDCCLLLEGMKGRSPLLLLLFMGKPFHGICAVEFCKIGEKPIENNQFNCSPWDMESYIIGPSALSAGMFDS